MNYEEALMMGGQGCAGVRGGQGEQTHEVGGGSEGNWTDISVSVPSLLGNLSVSQERFLALGDTSSI